MESVPGDVRVEDIPDIVKGLRSYFDTGATLSYEWRKRQLEGLSKVLKLHMDEWIAALHEDLGSHLYEAKMLILSSLSDIQHTMGKFKSWMKPKSISNPWILYPGGTELVPEPYGVVCDFIPFNYPINMGIDTLIPIIAAGNACVLKPSSNTPACARLYQTLIPRYMDNNAIKVFCGPTSICSSILECRFDFIFYTGSPSVAKSVMTAAARHLTPVLLELGGKSPVFVDKELHLEKCVKRLISGKMFNGGQTCVAPDYCLVHSSIFDEFVQKVQSVVQSFYGDVSQYNDNMTHIINKRHFDRLCNVIDTSGGNVVVMGHRDPERLYIGPTIIVNPSLESELMTEEIFGPVLPIISVESREAAIEFIRAREKPLALYILSSDSSTADLFTKRTSSGAILVNDVVFHVSSQDTPFGGVGNSGMGQYHGKFGFKNLSHLKPVMTHSTFFDFESRYPPYTQDKMDFASKFV